MNIALLPPVKLGRNPVYPLNTMHGEILVVYRKYQNNIHDYHLVKNMNSAVKKSSVMTINKQCIKGAKDMVMGYANKYFVELMDCLYVSYEQITPGYLMQNQE